MTASLRLRAPSDPVELSHDGDPVIVERGEPIAFGLVAAGRALLARSPKLHRPRGPFCMRRACDGCLARVDGVPNTMTCAVPARGGERVETQNVLGGRELDLLAATDFMFPQGFDHHRLLAGVRGVSGLLSSFARRVSGLGTLPEAPVAVRPARHADVDVLIVGGGSAGLCAARVLGSRAWLVDDAPALGGSLAALLPERANELVEAARDSGALLRPASAVLALSRELEPASGRLTALVVDAKGVELLRCRAVLVATGCHDRAPAFGNNDLPGIYAARAALRLLRAGIAVGRRVAWVGESRFADTFADLAAREINLVRVAPERVLRAKGRTGVTRLILGPASAGLREAETERELVVSAVVMDGRGAPSTELAVQAGAQVSFDPERGYVLNRAVDGRVAEHVYAAGSCASSPLSSADDGVRVAREIAARIA